MHFCKFRNSLECFLDHSHAFSFRNSFLSSDVLLDRLGINLPRYVIMPRNRCTSDVFSGTGMLTIASILEGSTCKPSGEKMCPTYLISLTPKTHLARFSFKPHDFILSRTSLNLLSCRSFPSPHIIISSCMCATPSKPSRSFEIRLLNISLAQCTPKGNRF